MQNPFGAKVSHTVNDSALQPYIMTFDKSIALKLRNTDMVLATKIAQQVFFIDPSLNYSLMIANQAQAEQIKTLPSVLMIGGVNIDFERFQKIMSGNF
jgi:hypothetical protein